MIEQVITKKNMRLACTHVVQNKGAAGVDGLQVSELYQHVQHREGIATAVTHGRYLPQPILGVSIPKSNGKTRLLGVPTVVDRWLQQCVLQAIAPRFEYEFKEFSYGFRPNKNALQCVQRSQQYINEGYRHIVDIDLQNFFDEVDHCLLLNRLYCKVKCPFTLGLIRKWLTAPMLIKGKLAKHHKGIPQGSPLSPLLSNIMLHELDKELEKQGCKYVRYADDFSIYAKSHQAARKPVHFEILGYKFIPIYQKGVKGQYQLVVSEKSWKKLQWNLKTITRKTAPKSITERTGKLKEVQRGWLQYFRMASISGKLRDMDGWVRNRLRYCIWADWKKPERKRKNLLRLGADLYHARVWSRTRKGGWPLLSRRYWEQR